MPGWWKVGTREKLQLREPLEMTWVWLSGTEGRVPGLQESLEAISLRAEPPSTFVASISVVSRLSGSQFRG